MKKNKNRPGYKKTKVGWIPSDWTDAPLGAAIDFVSGYSFDSSDFVSGGVPLLRISNITDGGVIFDDASAYLPEKFAVEFVRFLLKKDDLVVAMSGATTGKMAVYRAEKPVLLNQRTGVMRASKASGAIQTYINQYLTTHTNQVLRMAYGGAQPNISSKDIKRIRIPLPSLPEQEAIAEVLECWDKAIRGYERKIEKKRNVKKGLMQRLLSGRLRLSGFATTEYTEGHGKKKDGIPEGWKEVAFGDVFSIRRGTREMQIASSDYHLKGKYPVVDQGQDLVVGYSNNQTAFMDVPVIVFGDHTRVVKWVDFPFVIGADGTQLLATNDGLDLHYGFYLIADKSLPSLGYSRHMKLLKGSRFRIPSNIPEQRAIATVLSSADAEISALERKLATLREQKRFLLNNMVTGTIRLPQFRKELP